MKTLTKTIAAATFVCALAPMAYAATELTDEALDAILIALDDEYKAEALYADLIETFGTNTAFSNIAGAETTHADALVNLLEKYEQEVPKTHISQPRCRHSRFLLHWKRHMRPASLGKSTISPFTKKNSSRRLRNSLTSRGSSTTC